MLDSTFWILFFYITIMWITRYYAGKQCVQAIVQNKGTIFIPSLAFFVYYIIGTALFSQENTWNWENITLLYLYTFVPFAICVNIKKKFVPYLVLALVWLPIELKILPCKYSLFNLVYGATFALFIFRVYQFSIQKSISWKLKTKDLLAAIIYFGIFAAIVIPIGIYANILRYNLAAWNFLPMFKHLFLGYFCIALCEEIIFRELLLALILETTQSKKIALTISSILFGLCHIHKNLLGTSEFGVVFPNWTYVFLATFAGLFYGATWMVTRKATASAITHALVNFVRKLCFGTGVF